MPPHSKAEQSETQMLTTLLPTLPESLTPCFTRSTAIQVSHALSRAAGWPHRAGGCICALYRDHAACGTGSSPTHHLQNHEAGVCGAPAKGKTPCREVLVLDLLRNRLGCLRKLAMVSWPRRPNDFLVFHLRKINISC